MAKPAAPTEGVNAPVGYGPELEPHQVIRRPLITEKGTHISSKYNAYCFEVNTLADKLQIRDAVQKLFRVRVIGVRTQNRLGKTKRFKGRPGKLVDWKKAIVKLHPDDKIDFI